MGICLNPGAEKLRISRGHKFLFLERMNACSTAAMMSTALKRRSGRVSGRSICMGWGSQLDLSRRTFRKKWNTSCQRSQR